MRTVFLSSIIMVLCSANSLAWEATVDGPDVFGKTKVSALEGGLRNSLLIQCDSSGELVLVYLERKKEFEDTPEVPVKFFLKTGADAPHEFDATMKSWNENYSGVVIDKSSPNILSAIQSIGSAKKKIEVGIEILGQQFSWSFSSQGSGKAIAKVMKECNLAPAETQ